MRSRDRIEEEQCSSMSKHINTNHTDLLIVIPVGFAYVVKVETVGALWNFSLKPRSKQAKSRDPKALKTKSFHASMEPPKEATKTSIPLHKLLGPLLALQIMAPNTLTY